MPERSRVAHRAMWCLAIVTALAALRYFLVPAPLLRVPWAERFIDGPFAEAATEVAPSLYANHRLLLLLHIGCGVAALVLGLFQFLPRLRTERPRIHRRIGATYLVAVAIGAATGFPLSFLMIEHVSPEMRPALWPTVAGFASLAVAWGIVSAVALLHARQHRWSNHRDWMIRSYALTFAAVTVRLVAPVLLLLTSDPVVVVTGSVWSWPFNLAVAEMLIRRREAVVSEPLPRAGIAAP
jgi:uncharacterized membrane protein